MSFLAKFAASRYVGDKLEENFGPQNPKYDIHITPSGRRRKTKRPLPPGLTAHDARILATLRRKAYRYEWLVDCDCCCCLGGPHLQFGTVTLWGLLPVVGDVVSLLHALSLVRAARRVGDGGLPPRLLLLLLAWAAADFAVKLVPLAGDVLTAVVKPNTRNLMHVEAFLRARGERRLREAGQIVAGAGVDVVPGAGARADEPLLVTAQPPAQRGMSATAAAATTAGRAAGPSYGTVPAAAAGDRKGSRHLLPFWRRSEDSDSSDEEEGVERRG